MATLNCEMDKYQKECNKEHIMHGIAANLFCVMSKISPQDTPQQKDNGHSQETAC